MADLERSATAVWNGDLRGGNGKINAKSGLFKNAEYSFATRFENKPGTNPEELIAAAEAACFSMAFANALSKEGFTVESIETTATVVLSAKQGGGFRVSRIRLDTQGRVPGVDEGRFMQVAEDAKQNCPISVLLLPGLDGIDLKARLVR